MWVCRRAIAKDWNEFQKCGFKFSPTNLWIKVLIVCAAANSIEMIISPITHISVVITHWLCIVTFRKSHFKIQFTKMQKHSCLRLHARIITFSIVPCAERYQRNALFPFETSSWINALELVVTNPGEINCMTMAWCVCVACACACAFAGKMNTLTNTQTTTHNQHQWTCTIPFFRTDSDRKRVKKELWTRKVPL